MEGRECGLTRVANASSSAPVLFVKDSNPNKPNRWLAIPRELVHTLQQMSPEQRTAYWTAAIEKARSVWDDQWAIAINSEEKRSQCQLHAHIGKLLDTTDLPPGELVDRIEAIPVPPGGTGILIHPEGKQYRVHSGVLAPELSLMR
jgi:hypothetical protein